MEKCPDCDTQAICCRRVSARVRDHGKCRLCGLARSVRNRLCVACYGKVRCPRCAGTGFIPRFSHVSGGRCGLCGGTGRADPFRGGDYHRELGEYKEASKARAANGATRGAEKADVPTPSAVEQPPPPPPPKLDKSRVIDAALGDALTYDQIRAVLESQSRYDFTAEELDLLKDYEQKAIAGLPRVATSPMAVHSAQSWWSAAR